MILIICITCGLLYKYLHNTKYNILDKFIDMCSNTNMDLMDIIKTDFPSNLYSKNQYQQILNLGTFTSFDKYESTGFIDKKNLEIDTTKFLYQKLKFLNILASLNDYCRSNNNSNFISNFGIKITFNKEAGSSQSNLFETSFIDFNSQPELTNNKLLYISYYNGWIKIKSQLFNNYEQNIQLKGDLNYININSIVYRKNQKLELKCNIQISHDIDTNICFMLDNINDNSANITSINLFNNYYLSLLKFMLISYVKQYSIQIETKYIPILPSSNTSSFQSNFNSFYDRNFNTIKNNYINLFDNDIFNDKLKSDRLKPLFYDSYQTAKNNYEQNVIKERNANTLNESVNNILSIFNQLNINTKIDSFTDLKKKTTIEQRFVDKINNLKKLKNKVETFDNTSLVSQIYPPTILSTKSDIPGNLFNKIISNNQFNPANKITELKDLESEFGRISNNVYNILTALDRLPDNQQTVIG